jgi:hypothetical protein
LYDLLAQALLYGGGKLLDKLVDKSVSDAADVAYCSLKQAIKSRFPSAKVELAGMATSDPEAAAELKRSLIASGAADDPEINAEAQRVKEMSSLLHLLGREGYPKELPDAYKRNLDALKNPFPTAFDATLEHFAKAEKIRERMSETASEVRGLINNPITKDEFTLHFSIVPHTMLLLSEREQLKVKYLLSAMSVGDAFNFANTELRKKVGHGRTRGKYLDPNDFGIAYLAPADIVEDGAIPTNVVDLMKLVTVYMEKSNDMISSLVPKKE